jgi:hypothetical protein
MKKTGVALIFFLSSLAIHAQRIQAIVPSQVVAGNAFQIQYIINDPSDFLEINTPQFDNLQLISGPNYYKGNSLVNGKKQSIENVTYTVVPTKSGMIRINSVTARFKNNEEEKSDEISIRVLPQPKASFNALSTYTDINLYAPSTKTDLDKLIEQNLFVKTEVDKRVCFLGEDITATFKLYSRLQSTSEVINAPSLYGFSVMDILNTNESHQSVETINGQVFNTSVLRKLRLYPAHTGKLTIDEMELQNTVEFNDSVSGKKIKIDKAIASNTVDITVKGLPSKEPASFSGAVGKFMISAVLPKTKLVVNAAGQLLVTITGKGNFIQLGAPTIIWPQGFDVFDSVTFDELNKNATPTEGQRKYAFTFSSDQAGTFSIPPVSFSFFDPSIRRYETVRTDSLKLEVAAISPGQPRFAQKPQVPPTSKFWILLAIVLLLLPLAAILFQRRKKRENIPVPPSVKTNYLQRLSAISSEEFTGKQYCLEINRLLSDLSREYQLSYEQRKELVAIQNECQLVIYSDVDVTAKKEQLQARTEVFLKDVASSHSAYL